MARVFKRRMGDDTRYWSVDGQSPPSGRRQATIIGDLHVGSTGVGPHVVHQWTCPVSGGAPLCLDDYSEVVGPAPATRVWRMRRRQRFAS